MPKVTSNKRKSTYWCFTVNNPSVKDESRLLNLPYRYLVFQYEQGEEGTVHIQGYVALNSRWRFNQMKFAVPRAHWEPRVGTHEQARDYCLKSKTQLAGPYIYGSEKGLAKKPGQRKDLELVKEKIDAGADHATIWEEHFASSVRYHRAFDVYRDVKSHHRNPNVAPKLYIFWGPSGTGKTRKARDMFPDAYWLTKPSQRTSTVWWEGYTGQTVVVIDEYYGWLPYDLLLRLLDRSSVTVEKKGSSAKLAASTFVFTSNKPWTEWYPKVQDQHALKRRIEEFGVVEYIGGQYNFAASPGSPEI